MVYDFSANFKLRLPFQTISSTSFFVNSPPIRLAADLGTGRETIIKCHRQMDRISLCRFVCHCGRRFKHEFSIVCHQNNECGTDYRCQKCTFATNKLYMWLRHVTKMNCKPWKRRAVLTLTRRFPR
ncbi:uncharacterized protein LOC117224523 isoform X1 [Megalopta genalis]|uniref:uncharacterized protein LOC117224523 isoform X1 n=1 Tax=Megalopta genalis TaxID=115081 RepID=UPI003FD2017C